LNPTVILIQFDCLSAPFIPVKEVAVLNSATVKDLKLAIRKKINEIEQEQMGHRHISW
jgi:hypothetical protein